jgi:hypothetical protein
LWLTQNNYTNISTNKWAISIQNGTKLPDVWVNGDEIKSISDITSVIAGLDDYKTLTSIHTGYLLCAITSRILALNSGDVQELNAIIGLKESLKIVTKPPIEQLMTILSKPNDKGKKSRLVRGIRTNGVLTDSDFDDDQSLPSTISTGSMQSDYVAKLLLPDISDTMRINF